MLVGRDALVLRIEVDETGSWAPGLEWVGAWKMEVCVGDERGYLRGRPRGFGVGGLACRIT